MTLMTLLGLGVLTLILIFLGIILLPFVFWIVMLIDCLQRRFKDKNDKLVWALVLLLTYALGAIIYYFLVRRKNLH